MMYFTSFSLFYQHGLSFKKKTTGEFYWEIYYYGLSVSGATSKGKEYHSMKILPMYFKKIGQNNLSHCIGRLY